MKFEIGFTSNGNKQYSTSKIHVIIFLYLCNSLNEQDPKFDF